MSIPSPKTAKLARGSATLLAGLLALSAGNMQAQTVSAVAKLDKRSLTGTWYEIARIPNKREKHCAADAIELIALGDKPTQLQLVDACTDIKGYKDSWNFLATQKDASGALKVRTIFPFSRKYWVLAIDPSATSPAWSLIGTPNHKQLWIYARSATLAAGDLDQIKAKASAQGFDVSKLVASPQTPK